MATTAPNTTSTNKFETLAGMTREEYQAQVAQQSKHLPVAQIVPGNAGVSGKLGELLRMAELRRAGSGKKIPLWPVAWMKMPGADGQMTWTATNCPLTLYVVGGKRKVFPIWEAQGLQKVKVGEEERDNPNYGRFYVARYVDKIDPVTGNLVLNDKGYPVQDLDSFRWFNQTDFVLSGALQVVAPNLEALLTRNGCGDGDLWPQDLLNQVFLRGLSDKEIVKEWQKSVKASSE